LTSFQNGFADVRHPAPRDPPIMNPMAFTTTRQLTAMGPNRPGLHSRSVTASVAPTQQSQSSARPNDMMLLSGDEGGDEPFSDDDMLSRMTTSDESISGPSNNAKPITGIRAGWRSGVRRLTGGSGTAGDKREVRDAMRGGQKSPRVPKVPTVWLHNPRSADL